MVAWALLFGLPSIALAAVLWAVTGSRWGGAAVSGAIAAAAAGCAGAPLPAVVVPAVGTDARDRIHPGQQAGDPTGGQMTIFPVVLLVALLPSVFGGSWWGCVLAAVLLAAVVLGVSPALTVRLLQRRGTGLLDAMISRDTAALRSAAWTRGPLTRPLEIRSHDRPGGLHGLRRRAAGHREDSWANPSPPPAIADVIRPTTDCAPPRPPRRTAGRRTAHFRPGGTVIVLKGVAGRDLWGGAMRVVAPS